MNRGAGGHDEDRALAERLVRYGRDSGADELEIGIGEGDEFNVDVRHGRIENLIEAGSRYAGVRVIKDKKTAFASSEANAGNLSQHRAVMKYT